MNVFGSSPGQVAVFRSLEAVGMTVSVEGLTDRNGAYETMRCAVSSIGLGESVHALFSPSMSGLLYVYVFGDKPAGAEITGYHFANPCGGGPSGMERVHQYWRASRASKRRTAVGLALGTKIALKGFLTDITLGSHDPVTGFGQFKMTLVYMPVN